MPLPPVLASLPSALTTLPSALTSLLSLARPSGHRAHPLPGADLELPWPRGSGRRAPEVSVSGIDPRIAVAPAVPRLHLVADAAVPAPRSLADLLDPRDGAGAAAPHVRHLTVDVRHLAEVLERRGGARLLAQIVQDPTDRVANAVFRAAMRTPSPAGGADGADTDCEVLLGDEGDSLAGRCRVDLGRGRMMLLALLTEGERATRRLAEALARPRDRDVRRQLEETLAHRVAELPLEALIRAAATPRGGSGRVDDQHVDPGAA